MSGSRSPASCSAARTTIDAAHVKVFDKTGKLIKEIGKGTFTTVMNEIGYCAENDTIVHPGVRREDLGAEGRRRRARS